MALVTPTWRSVALRVKLPTVKFVLVEPRPIVGAVAGARLLPAPVPWISV